MADHEAFKAKVATLRKGQYRGIDIIKTWMPELKGMETVLRIKLHEAQPYLFGLSATLPQHFIYTNTHGLDLLTVK